MLITKAIFERKISAFDPQVCVIDTIERIYSRLSFRSCFPFVHFMIF